MAKYSDIGHGMRRRMGAPSNHHESAGNNMSDHNHATADEAMEHHASVGSARVSLGDVRPPLAGTLMPRKNTQSADPVNPGSKQNRVNILANPGMERNGATYRVTASMGAQLDPSAGATMHSARIVPSIQGRANPNFESGIQQSL
jgi:hypothetical protein